MINKKIPISIQRFFWDTDPRHIDLEENTNYVVSRIFEYGDFGAVRWVFKQYPQQRIANILQHSRQVTPRTREFWSCYLRHHAE
jgi:hypothetical protein